MRPYLITIRDLMLFVVLPLAFAVWVVYGVFAKKPGEDDEFKEGGV